MKLEVQSAAEGPVKVDVVVKKSRPLPTRPGKKPTLAYERSWMERGHALVAGVDEAGRGPLAGPVSVAAVILPEGFKHKKLNDSKQLNHETRESIFADLMKCQGLVWCHVLIEVEEIDRINILQATHLGMRRATQGLSTRPHAVLIDGSPVPNFPYPGQSIVEGDAISLSIAAASIIAKVLRDRHMMEVAQVYPQYGFERHKGYGTPEHLRALRNHGPCPLHRKSFAPVAQMSLPLTFEDVTGE
ncbi:RNase HII [Roseimicrobium gellanilyticum]|uniref:Ribonuclease HII n=1 Tax=Roseimicrobium gellanilyticum TaxID=748857 RepID=A0A366HQ40_9BACT|nr:ribonuclease HII [Roseimicrobium gellanilyticum]RBP45761.1 RNase HII [Roseimicrobium gellanilyticum]